MALARGPETHIFKSTPTTDLAVDIYRTSDQSQGCLAFLHGGALLLGSRSDLPASVVSLLNKKGWDVASLDYRTALETNLGEILSDVDSGCEFIRGLLPGAPLVLVGYSAGAYLSLLSGARGVKVDGICAFAGYGNLSAGWYYQPSDFFLAYKNVESVKQRLEDRASFTTLEDRIDLYVYLRQQGLWPEFVLGKEDLRSQAESFSPICHLSAHYPRAVLIHGTSDNDVPVAASIEMAGALKNRDLPHKLILLEGRDHDLFFNLEDDGVVGAWDDALAFLSPNGTIEEELRNASFSAPRDM